jgi:hypothetical protein
MKGATVIKGIKTDQKDKKQKTNIREITAVLVSQEITIISYQFLSL